MLVPEGFVEVRADRTVVLVRRDLADVVPGSWWDGGRALASARGRGGVVQARIDGVDVVLRTYKRGGLLRALLPDAFVSPARARAELATIAKLRARGVPVVDPVAAIARRRGLSWELRLATVLVHGALPLPAFLARHAAARRAAVREAGRVVGASFAAGLRHPDLHPDNLIARAVDPAVVEVRLLDLDRARLADRAVTPAEQDVMLVRMARYLLRHRGALPCTPSATDLSRFLAGLGLDRLGRRAAFARLAPALARQAARRRLPMLQLPHAGARRSDQIRTRSA